MLAQQRKADAAAAANSGAPPALASTQSGPQNGADKGGSNGSNETSKARTPTLAAGMPAGEVPPFYLQRCSYAGASMARVPAGASGAGLEIQLAPATPAKAAGMGLPANLAGLSLSAKGKQGPASAEGSLAPGADGTSFVHVPAGQVSPAFVCGAPPGQHGGSMPLHASPSA